MPSTPKPPAGVRSVSACVSGSGESPLPSRQLQRFLLFFHVVFIGGLAISLGVRWRRPGHAPGIEDLVLVGLVAVQVAFYLRVFAFAGPGDRSPSPRLWAVYFLTSAVVFLIECRIETAFYWAIGAYLGQLLALPWRTALPAAGVLLAGFLLVAFGWTGLAQFGVWEWLIAVGSLAAWVGLALFLHRALATSSERGRLIRELEAAKLELEAARRRDAELAVLEERERLARDLHDSLGHALVTLTVQLEAAQRLVGSEPARAGVILGEMLRLTRSSMEDLRRSLANLRVAGLGDRALGDALRALCREAGSRAGLSVDCDLAEGADRLPPRVSEVIWRVAQEGLINVGRHAGARRVRVSLGMAEGWVRLRVSDDGTGLPADAEAKPGHYGLRGLREQVEGVGGTFLASGPGDEGATIEAQIPVRTA